MSLLSTVRMHRHGASRDGPAWIIFRTSTAGRRKRFSLAGMAGLLLVGVGVIRSAASTETSWRVQQWAVTAKPAVGYEGSGNLHAGRRFPRGRANTNIGKPAIQIDVSFQATANGTAAAFWPDAATLQVLRSQATDGPYQVVETFGPSEVQQPLESSDAHVTVNGEARPRRHYLFSITDAKVECGTQYFCKVRFLRTHPKTPLEVI